MIAPRLLGLVQRGVGTGEQGQAGIRWFEVGNSDAGGNRRQFVDRAAALDGPAKFFREGPCPLRRYAVQQADEFLTPDAGRQIARSQHQPRNARNLYQHPISRTAPDGFVNRLEPIQIENHQRQRLPGLARRHDGTIDPRHRVTAIGKARQLIDVGEIGFFAGHCARHFLFFPASPRLVIFIGDIASDHDDVPGLAVGTGLVAGFQTEQANLPIGARYVAFQREGLGILRMPAERSQQTSTTGAQHSVEHGGIRMLLRGNSHEAAQAGRPLVRIAVRPVLPATRFAEVFGHLQQADLFGQRGIACRQPANDGELEKGKRAQQEQRCHQGSDRAHAARDACDNACNQQGEGCQCHPKHDFPVNRFHQLDLPTRIGISTGPTPNVDRTRKGYFALTAGGNQIRQPSPLIGIGPIRPRPGGSPSFRD